VGGGKPLAGKLGENIPAAIFPIHKVSRIPYLPKFSVRSAFMESRGKASAVSGKQKCLHTTLLHLMFTLSGIEFIYVPNALYIGSHIISTYAPINIGIFSSSWNQNVCNTFSKS